MDLNGGRGDLGNNYYIVPDENNEDNTYIDPDDMNNAHYGSFNPNVNMLGNGQLYYNDQTSQGLTQHPVYVHDQQPLAAADFFSSPQGHTGNSFVIPQPQTAGHFAAALSSPVSPGSFSIGQHNTGHFIPANAFSHAAQASIQHELAVAPLRRSIALPPHPAAMSQDASRTNSMDSVTTEASQPVPAKNGPCSRAIQVPARPKPGRKPMPPGEASDRRRTQNRMAQRNFRDKRQQKVGELNDEIAALNEKIKAQAMNLQHMRTALERQQHESRDQLQAERIRHQAEMSEMLRKMEVGRVPVMDSQGQVTNPQYGNVDYQQRFSGPKLPAISTTANDKHQEVAIPTPPEDNWNEIDMTDAWNRLKPSNHLPHDSNNWNGYDMETDPINDSGCGFCTDASNCACRASLTTAAKQTSSGPGTCDMCQQDPARAAACRSLADKTQPSTAVETSVESSTPNKTMSCGQFIDKFNKDMGRMPSIVELFGPLHSFPARNGFNVDEQEAAKALQGLSAMPPASRH